MSYVNKVVNRELEDAKVGYKFLLDQKARYEQSMKELSDNINNAEARIQELEQFLGANND